MNLKESYQELVRRIKVNSKAAGRKLRNEDIAERLGYNSDYFSTLNGKSGVVQERHIKDLQDAFQDELAGIVKPSLPGDTLNRERAIIKVLFQEVAKLKAEKLGVPVQKVLEDMENDTMIAWRDLENQ